VLSLFLALIPQQVGWGWARDLEGSQAGQLTLAYQGGIPYYVTSCSAIKCGGTIFPK